MGALKALDRWLAKLETATLALMLALMLGGALLSMVLRWMGTGLSALEPILRYGVLWLGFMGGVAAVRNQGHIQIGSLSRLLPQWAARLVYRLQSLVAAGICLTLSRACLRFVVDERDFGTTGFGDVPLWILQIILPVGFGLMALRFILLAALGAPEQEEGDDPTQGQADPGSSAPDSGAQGAGGLEAAADAPGGSP